MTFTDWFRLRIDGSLRWQQALAVSIGVLILLGPARHASRRRRGLAQAVRGRAKEVRWGFGEGEDRLSTGGATEAGPPSP